MLRLLWRRAERAERAAAAARGEAAVAAAEDDAAEVAADAARLADLVEGLTIHLRTSLGRVMADPRVPDAAREVAAERANARIAVVPLGLEAWLDAAAARPDFWGVVFPLLRHVLGPLEAAGGFEPSTDGRGGAVSAANGERMEARAEALVAAQLPPGWSLLSKGHVVALDGRHPNHSAACKWEVDLLALDATGTAVALFEAKTANANPLMTLLTDVERVCALADRLAGVSTVTLRVREEPGVEAAAAAAAVAAAAAAFAVEEGESDPGSGSSSGSSGSSSDEDGGAARAEQLTVQQRRRLRRVAAAADKNRKLWRDVTVPVHPQLQPVYVLGRPLRRKDLRRGLASAASAEALKLGARDPAALAAALGLGGGDGDGDGVGSDGDDDDEAASLPDTPRSGFSDLSSGTSSELGSELSGPWAAPDDGPRLVMALPQEWRESISARVLSRLDLLTTRCTVLAVDGGATGGGPAGAAPSLAKN